MICMNIIHTYIYINDKVHMYNKCYCTKYEIRNIIVKCQPPNANANQKCPLISPTHINDQYIQIPIMN